MTENRDRVFEEDDNDSNSVNFHGSKLQLQKSKDVDEVYESLKRNWLVKGLGEIKKKLPRSCGLY